MNRQHWDGWRVLRADITGIEANRAGETTMRAVAVFVGREV